MPTYLSSNTIDVFGDSNTRFTADTTTITQKYVKDLPPGVTLTSDEPLVQPWALLATVASVPSSVINVYAWDNIVIYNASNGIVTISANGDDDNAMVIMPSSQVIYSNVNGVFGNLTVLTNAGTGSLYIWGSV
jgi:hypothetical protein